MMKTATRISKLFHEIEREVAAGLASGELCESFTYRFFLPESKEKTDAMVGFEFRARPCKKDAEVYKTNHTLRLKRRHVEKAQKVCRLIRRHGYTFSDTKRVLDVYTGESSLSSVYECSYDVEKGEKRFGCKTVTELQSYKDIDELLKNLEAM